MSLRLHCSLIGYNDFSLGPRTLEPLQTFPLLVSIGNTLSEAVCSLPEAMKVEGEESKQMEER